MLLKDAIEGNKGTGPGFHFLRHALSILILFHHLRVMIIGGKANSITDGGYTKGAILTANSYGSFVVELLRPGLYSLVGIFFALSGFLIMGSALRSQSVRVFFTNRALRILPALSVEVALSALGIGPIVTVLPIAAYFSDPELYRYFGNIVGHVYYLLPGVFLDNPWPGIVNGNLWTLPAEFYCYLIMLAILATGLLKHHRKLTIITFTVTLIWMGLQFYDESYSVRADQTHFTSWYIVLLFFMGAAAYVNADRIYLHPGLFIFAALAYYLSIITDVATPISGVFLTYCMIYLGFCKFPLFDRLVENDLSYGIYLYGWPISQTMIWLTAPYLVGFPTYAKLALLGPAVLIGVVVFATLSWRYIERPALSLRKVFANSKVKSLSAT